ncbi:MAG: substrate-binding domain-containing protein [Raineya sp.]|nr:substrate-binding domain-containing protein [Raineya sp.]MDW8295832.1 substrate-binding domain-containing protein [Raineya sp.]
MIELKIGGVPEHFNLPWQLAIEEGLFEKAGIHLQWIDHAGGTGSMTKALREGELDLAICLTEGIVADIVKGNGSKIVKIYVKSPLTWGLYVKKDSPFAKVADLENQRIGISRWGSGSHLMAFVKARQLGWNTENLQFVPLKNLEGIREAIAAGQAEWFMWEKVMTEPYVSNGELRLVDTCVTPWSCFVIAVREEILQKYLPFVQKIAEIINHYVQDFKQRPRIIELLAERYQIDLEDTAHWLHQTHWATDNLVPAEMIEQVQQTLLELKIIEQKKRYPEIVQVLD